MKTYRGERTFDGIVVSVDGHPLAEQRDLKNFSDNSFEWGYEGNESRQLALAILADCMGGDAALAHVDGFMREIVANFSNEWEITDSQVSRAVADLRRLSGPAADL
ncbi:MAG: DUF6166 domain-containing protein [Burkholderiaceae bacterium]